MDFLQQGEWCFTYHRQLRDVMCHTKAEMIDLIKIWKPLIYQGTLRVEAENNKSLIRTKSGKTYHALVIQTTEAEQNATDEFALNEFGFLVYGIVYFFASAENRDFVFGEITAED